MGGSTPTAAQVVGRSLWRTSSEKEHLHIVISGADFAVQHLCTVVVTPVIHYRMGGWKLVVSALETFVHRLQDVEDEFRGVGLSAGRNGDR